MEAVWGKRGALFDLKADVGEQKIVAAEHPDIVKQLVSLAQQAEQDIGNGNRPGKNARIEDAAPPGKETK